MTPQEIAVRLKELFTHHHWAQAQQELFSDDTVSIEPENAAVPLAKGKEAIQKKADDFNQSVETVHSGSVTDPIVAGNFIAMGISMDVTIKEKGRMQLNEMVIYEVRDGKIVKEQFFY